MNISIGDGKWKWVVQLTGLGLLVLNKNIWDEDDRVMKKKWEEKEIVIKPKIMAHLEMVNKLQYFKYKPTNLLEDRDHRCKRFPDKNQRVDGGGSFWSDPFLKILLDSFHRSSSSPFFLDFYKFERMEISGTRKTYLEEDWHHLIDF